MGCNLQVAKQKILNKWDWSNAGKSEPVILWGAPGIGKTQLICQLVGERMLHEMNQQIEELEAKGSSKELENLKVRYENTRTKLDNFEDVTTDILEAIEDHLLVIRLAERPIEQLQGVIVPSKSTEWADFVLPKNFEKVKKSKWGIIFFDELDKASETKFGAATHILENNVVGDFQMPAGWFCIAACNREEDSFLSNPVPPELRNRTANIEVDFDADLWISWAMKHNIRKDIVYFIRAQPRWLANYDDDNGYAFPTPRTWAKVSRAIDRLERRVKPGPDQKEEFYDKFARGEMEDFVGKRAATEYFGWRKTYMSYPVEEILNGKKMVPYMKEGDSSQSLISEHCIGALALSDQLGAEDGPQVLFPAGCSREDKERRIGNLCRFIDALHADIRTIFVQSLYKKPVYTVIQGFMEADKTFNDIMKQIAV